MLRITEVRLPLDHPEDAIPAAVLKRLGIAAHELAGYSIFRRAVDARKPAIAFTYTLDAEVRNEPALLARLKDDRRVTRSPDTSYQFVAQAPAGIKARPVVIGTGPCGLFAGLLLAQMGLRPLILDRGKIVRERTRDTWGLWRKSVLDPESNVQFGEGGAGTFSDGKLYSQVKDPRHLGRKVLARMVERIEHQQLDAAPDFLRDAVVLEAGDEIGDTARVVVIGGWLRHRVRSITHLN